MTDAFDQAFPAAVGKAGGCTQDPADAGNGRAGAPGRGRRRGTRPGISAAAYPLLDIAGMPP